MGSRSFVTVLVGLLLLALLPVSCGQPADTGLVMVTRVIDGDTIEIEGKRTVRYIGIDTPEMRPSPEQYAREATEYNKKLVSGRRVRLEKDVSETDRYSRLLRYVYVDDTFVNYELVRKGLARARAYPPDTRHQPVLQEAEREAKREKLGIWSSSSRSIFDIIYVKPSPDGLTVPCTNPGRGLSALLFP